MPNRSSRLRVLTYVAAAGLAFQLVHLVEHIAQMAYWFAHPELPPWLTPWALVGRGLLSDVPSIGNELLHLIGNNLFLTGLLALEMISNTRARAHAGRPNLTKAIWIQGFHVFEHVLLTFTTLWLGEAAGFSTLFGTLNGTVLWTTRVWFHFAINLFATVYAVRAFRVMYRDGVIIGPAPASVVARA